MAAPAGPNPFSGIWQILREDREFEQYDGKSLRNRPWPHRDSRRRVRIFADCLGNFGSAVPHFDNCGMRNRYRRPYCLGLVRPALESFGCVPTDGVIALMR